ncbi:MAG TPA: HdeD family acid-resistance protein [Candidatus Acidoferrales bacterium]|nr:HdeD family acid-resistance protein [Candidatus Acidoferrales bacterium]
MKATVAGVAVEAIDEAHKNWGWYLAMGVVLMLAGLYCIWAEGMATMASVVVLGAILMVGGIAQIAAAFVAKGSGAVIVLLLAGFLEIVVGLMLIGHPGVGAITITLFIAMLLVFGGVYRLVSALVMQAPHLGWAVLGGIVTALLGIMLWAQWPFSATWFIGFAVGISFLFQGAGWSSLAFKLKSLPQQS